MEPTTSLIVVEKESSLFVTTTEHQHEVRLQSGSFWSQHLLCSHSFDKWTCKSSFYSCMTVQAMVFFFWLVPKVSQLNISDLLMNSKNKNMKPVIHKNICTK
jgi:hypothetical protein